MKNDCGAEALTLLKKRGEHVCFAESLWGNMRLAPLEMARVPNEE